jgi:hypothetical protein
MLSKNWVLLFCSLLVSCANVPNVPVCFELDITRGYCINTLSQEGFYVDETNLLDGKTWFENRISMVMMPAKSWGELKSYILKNCKRTGKCAEIEKFNQQLKPVEKNQEPYYNF